MMFALCARLRSMVKYWTSKWSERMFFFQWQMRPMRKYPSKNIDKFDFCFKMFLTKCFLQWKRLLYLLLFNDQPAENLSQYIYIYMSWYTLNHPGKEIQESWTCLSGNCVFSGRDKLKKSFGWVTKLIQLLLNVVCWTYLDTNLSEGSW